VAADLVVDAAEERFAAMGTDVHVLVCAAGAHELVDGARAHIDRLERRWSRFIVDSELNRLNALAGMPCVVSTETFDLVERAVRAWRATGGRFDPTVLDAVRAAGYTTSFVELAAGAPVVVDRAGARPAPGCDAIVLEPALRVVHLPAGVGIDPGGIGKGYAADLVAAELRAAGATGVCVNVGGDLRVSGPCADGGAWLIDVAAPFGDEAVAQVCVADGAVATSSRTRRHWQTDDGLRHHIVDPSTGTSAATGVASVTIVAGEAWWAEALAKAAFLAGPRDAAGVVVEHGAAGILVTDHGDVQMLGPIGEFLA
jgi:thiamine biosynthesis lipoprotein